MSRSTRRTRRTRCTRRLRRARRLLVVAVAGAAAAASAVRSRRRCAPLHVGDAAPTWPPHTAAVPQPEPEPVPAGGTSAPWVDPVDGTCPLTHPVKGNAGSGIYHLPGTRYYDRTVPERCYRDPAAAEADGMRAPRR